jgi:hypothetical protein
MQRQGKIAYLYNGYEDQFFMMYQWSLGKLLDKYFPEVGRGQRIIHVHPEAGTLNRFHSLSS